jgi:two-component system sensor histidine kinase/response regulator
MVAAVNTRDDTRRDESKVTTDLSSDHSHRDNSTSSRPRRELRILVAEDSPANQLIVSRMLSRRGHQAVLVGDGRAALRLVTNERFDAVLMDVHMPAMDGLEATRRIRTRFGSDLPIVAFSAYTSGIDRDECFSAGMNAFLCKPADFAILTQTIESLCHA